MPVVNGLVVTVAAVAAAAELGSSAVAVLRLQGGEVAAFGDGVVFAVKQAVVHAVVVVDVEVVEGVQRDVGVFDGVDGVADGGHERGVGGVFDARGDGGGDGGDGHELAPPLFGQGAQDGFDFGRQHGGNEAFVVGGVERVQGGEWHAEGDAVGAAARFEVVFEAQFLAVVGEAFRVVGVTGGVVHQQQVGFTHGERRFAVLFEPLFEGDGAVYVFGQAGVVPGGLLGFVRQDAPAAGFVFAFFEGFDKGAVFGDDAAFGVDVAGDEGVLDEDVVGERRVVAGVGDVASGDDGQAVEQGGLGGEDVAGFFAPMGVGVGVFDEVGGDVFEVGQLDGGAGARVGALGFDDAGGHDGLRRFFGEHGGGIDAVAGVARAQVVAGLFVPEADLVEEAGEQCAVQGVKLRVVVGEAAFGAVRQVVLWCGGGYGVEVQFLFAQVADELVGEFAPFAHALRVQVVVFAPGTQAVVAGGAAFALVGGEEVEQGLVVAGFVGEFALFLVGARFLAVGAFARVLDGEGGDEDDGVLQAAGFFGGVDDAREAGVNRQVRHLSPKRGEAARFVGGAQFEEQAVAVVDLPRVGRVNEGEGGDVAQFEDEHLQDDGGEVGAQDFRLGVGGALAVVVFAVEADADAAGGTATSAGALVGGGLRDGLNRQALGFGAQAVAADARGAGVDDGFDARHGERGFGDVGGKHDAPRRLRAEDALLVGEREAAKEGQYVRVAQLFAAQAVGGFADVAFAGEEDEDVAASVLVEFGDGAEDGVRAVFVFVRRAVADFHGVGAAADVEDGRVFEVGGEFVGVDGGRGDDDFEVGAFVGEAAQVAEEEVDVEAAFVRFVHDDDFVAGEVGVGQGFGEQHAVGHQFDNGLFAGFFVETDLVADGGAKRFVQFFGDAGGDAARGDTARLGVGNHAARAEAEGEAELRQLCGFPRSGFAADDDDLVVGNQAADFVGNRQHGQVGAQFRCRQGGTARGDRFLRGGVVSGKARPHTVGRLAAPLTFANLAVELLQGVAVLAADGGEIGGGHGLCGMGKAADYSRLRRGRFSGFCYWRVVYPVIAPRVPWKPIVYRQQIAAPPVSHYPNHFFIYAGLPS
ncbi:hypothetical protein HMPREF9080_00622 [Cardiobacterium valvarum F0432]|uniref:Uncharacterized protein n=1 Tax=Cardiobacterium valvarum F0432 TaxID=797473 RepID=G9ZCZ2_9GAMM|nr:hypothetical protein HMPREF9080_00622 [Cardiobacterium valvarum F0432]